MLNSLSAWLTAPPSFVPQCKLGYQGQGKTQDLESGTGMVGDPGVKREDLQATPEVEPNGHWKM